MTWKLYHFVRHQMEEVEVYALTDAQAEAFMPQHPVIQSVYVLLRAQGSTVIDALIEVLKIQLVSGGQTRIIPQGKET